MYNEFTIIVLIFHPGIVHYSETYTQKVKISDIYKSPLCAFVIIVEGSICFRSATRQLTLQLGRKPLQSINLTFNWTARLNLNNPGHTKPFIKYVHLLILALPGTFPFSVLTRKWLLVRANSINDRVVSELMINVNGSRKLSRREEDFFNVIKNVRWKNFRSRRIFVHYQQLFVLVYYLRTNWRRKRWSSRNKYLTVRFNYL